MSSSFVAALKIVLSHTIQNMICIKIRFSEEEFETIFFCFVWRKQNLL